MRNSRFVLLFVFVLAVVSATAQQSSPPTAQVTGSGPGPTPVQRDQQALNVLGQSLASMGQGSGGNTIHDFSASGTITYYWAPQPSSGEVTVKGRGTDQFRLEAHLDQGVRSYTVSHGKGSFIETDGQKSEVVPDEAI